MQRKKSSDIWHTFCCRKRSQNNYIFNVSLNSKIHINYSLAHTNAQNCCALKYLAHSMSTKIHSGLMGKVAVYVDCCLMLMSFSKYEYQKLKAHLHLSGDSTSKLPGGYLVYLSQGDVLFFRALFSPVVSLECI